MRIHGLSGRNQATEKWLEKLINNLNLKQTVVSVQKYEFWKNPELKLELEAEFVTLKKSAADLVIAKSLGVLIAIDSFTRDIFRAPAYVLIGVPLVGFTEENTYSLNQLCQKTPALLIQKKDDPSGSFSMLSEAIKKPYDSKLIEMPGNDHQYAEIEDLKNYIEHWYATLAK